MDRIELNGIRVHGHHGVLDHERELGQPFIVDLVLELDLAAAAASDELADTVDYGSLAGEVAALVSGRPARLLETLADRLARHCLARPGVEAVEVRVAKPRAPLPLATGDVAVRLRRERA